MCAIAKSMPVDAIHLAASLQAEGYRLPAFFREWVKVREQYGSRDDWDRTIGSVSELVRAERLQTDVHEWLGAALRLDENA